MPITPQELVANLDDLPPMPQVASLVLGVSADPNAAAEDLCRAISMDQALTSLILKISNSELFGMARTVATLTQAIMVLGFPTIQSVVIASSAKHINHRRSVGPQERLIWEHALVSAMAGDAIAKSLRFPMPEEAFIGGLLHDLGKSVLLVKFPEHYGALLRAVCREDRPCLELELDTFGFDHAMVGEALGNQWNLAPCLQAALRWHHDPIQAPEAHRELAAIVALANHLALEEEAGMGNPCLAEEAAMQARAILKVSPETLVGIKESLRAALVQHRTRLAAL